jgi:hypothetical protein
LLAAVLHPGAVLAWGTENTHWRLADNARDRFDRDSAFTAFLQRELDLPKGLDEPLAVQLGFDEAIDEEIGPINGSRLNRSRNLELSPDAPDDVYIHLNQRCFGLGSPDPACFSNLKRAPIDQLIRAGAWAEDNPNPRARHHFHDPTFEHAPPPGNHGLDDQKLAPGLNFIAELATVVFRGGEWGRFWASFKKYNPFSPEIDPDFGHFEYRGRSALDRALNLPLGAAPLPSTRSPENLFALPDAERYLYLGLTASREDEREHYLALHFIAFGHVLHLLQDMSSPGHVRNDFIMEHALRTFASFEAVGDKRPVATSVIGKLGSANSPPWQFLADQGISDPRYLQTLGGFTLDATGLEIAGFWDQGSQSAADGAGLAEIVQRHVFSTGSIGGAPGEPSEYPYPLLPESCALTESEGSGDSLVFVAELPARTLKEGLVVNPGETQRFLSSPMIPHLGRCRYHAELLGTDSLFAVTVVDESVQRDYLEVLWPFTIDYTAKLMENYYQPRLSLVPQSLDSFKLANPTMLEFEAAIDSVEIVYDGIDGQRHSALASCSGDIELRLPPAASPDELGEESDLTCTMPALNTLPVLPAREDFWVVVRGALGSRGDFGSENEYDEGSKEFVVAFTHVRPEIFFDRIILDPPSPPVSDGSEKVDVYSIWVDLDQEHLAGTSKGQVPQNRTAALRNSPAAAELDFALPEQDPSTPGRLVIRHDGGAPSNQQYPLFVAGTLMDLGILQLVPGSESGVALTPVENSQTDFLSGMRGGARWSPDGRFLFAERINPSSHEYTRFDLDTNEAVELVLADLFSVVSEDVDTATVEICDQLRSVTPVSATEVAATVICYRRLFDKSSETFIDTDRSGESIFLAALTPSGEDLSIDITMVIDMVSGTPAFEPCPLAHNPTKPQGSPQGFRCPAILTESLQWGEEAFVEDNGDAKLAFLHNLHEKPDGTAHRGEPGPLTDIVIADLQSQSQTMTIAVKDIVARTEPTQGGGTINIAPSPAHWSPSGGMLAFYDPKTDQIEVATVADMSALPVDPIPIAWVPNIAKTLTWGIPLRFPSGN